MTEPKIRSFPGDIEIEYDGTKSDEEVDAMAAEDFEKIIDRSTGAPAWLRMRVGDAPSEGGRLSTLRKFAPKSWGYGVDNFLFLSPETNKLTLYNPEGFDFGDVASVGGEIARGVGATAGGIVGAAGGPAVAMAGAAGGSALGGQLYEAAMRQKADPYATVDPRSTGRRLGEEAITSGMAGAGEGVAKALPFAVKGAIRGIGNAAAAAQERLTNALDIGVNLPLGDISQRRWVQGLQNAAADMFGGGRLRTAAERAIARLDEVTTSPLGSRTIQEGGAALQEGAPNYVNRFQRISGRMFDRALSGVTDNPVTPTNTASATGAVMSAIGNDLPATGKLLTPSLYTALQADIAAGAVPRLSTMRAVRTEVGKKLADPMMIDDASRGNLKQLYSAITDDIRASLPPDRVARFDQANEFYRNGIRFIDETMQKIVDKGVTPEQAFGWAMAQSKGGGARLAAVRQGMSANEWDVFASAVLTKMGRAKPGMQTAEGDAFSPATYLSNFAAMSPEAKNVVFGTSPMFRALRPQLEKAARVMENMRGTEMMYNKSRTAPALYWMRTLSSGGGLGALGALAGGEVGAVAGASFGLMAPWTVAKLWTNPATVRWMIQPVAKNGFAAHIGRLSGIAASEPAMEGPIRELLDTLSLSGGTPEQPEEGAK